MSYLKDRLPELLPAEAIPSEPWRKALMDAAELIRKQGHCKGDFETDDGRLCAVGAINKVQSGQSWRDGADREAYNAARIAVTRQIDCPSLPRWNDAPERTAEEVISALEAAARS